MVLREQLDRQAREATELSIPLDRNRVQCVACGHRCPISPGFAGVCKVRFNREGKLYAPWGYVNGAYCDPIEKKPFFHALPGARAFSFGMLGCDLHCGYCQNWVSSQALRDVQSSVDFTPASGEQLVRMARQQGAAAMVSTYNEPLITAEWAVSVFKEARKAGMVTGFVSNGNATPEALRYLRPWVDLYKVDLKSFDDRSYHALGGRIGPILDAIGMIHEMGFWLEIVTLMVPGFNDSDEELSRMAAFIAGVSPDIPWHVTAFHKDYKMLGPEDTPPETLVRAAGIGRAAGLRYVYAGNLPGHIGALEDTHCPCCWRTVVERRGFRVVRNRLGAGGACPDCGTSIPGFWSGAATTPEPRPDLLNIFRG
jgi:pyruvate formate lyase activating enzyme